MGISQSSESHLQRKPRSIRTFFYQKAVLFQRAQRACQCYYLMFWEIWSRAVLCHQTADLCCSGSARRLYSEPPELRHDSRKVAVAVTRQGNNPNSQVFKFRWARQDSPLTGGNGRAVADCTHAGVHSSSSPSFLLIVYKKIRSVTQVNSVVSELVFCLWVSLHSHIFNKHLKQSGLCLCLLCPCAWLHEQGSCENVFYTLSPRHSRCS